MPSPPPLPALSIEALFAHLREGMAAGITVVTPNRRLASALAGRFDAAQSAAGHAAWETPDILPFDAFVARLHGDALYSEEALGLPALLTQAQEQVLWEQAIAASPWQALLLSPARTAAQARQAWMLAHHWRIEGMLGQFPGNEDAAAFAAWAAHYRRQTGAANLTDPARLPDLVAGLLDRPALHKPRLLVLYAFDIVTPQLQLFTDNCRQQGIAVHVCRSAAQPATPVRIPCATAEAELAAAAQWARARLLAAGEQPVRIGVVLPALEQRRAQVMRLFTQALQPDWHRQPGRAASAPFNVSLGTPLARHALVHAALALLQLALAETGFATASRLLRSPFIGAAETEMPARARLDANLRREAPARLTLAGLVALVTAMDMTPALQRHLQQLLDAVRALPGRRQPLHAWAGHFARLLSAAGFPGERSSDSAEYQTLAAWQQALSGLGALAGVAPETNAAQALARLRQLCEDTLFQPESGTAPVQVLGVLESAGLEFDHLWVAGMTDEAWPMPARPNPFLPAALQQKAGVPEAAAATALELDRHITAHWLQAAPEVVISHALREEDRELEPSPLVASIATGCVQYEVLPDTARTMREESALEALGDPALPPLSAAAATPLRGGTRVLADQADCPFRAFAAHRLAAEPLRTPAEGLDAAARGELLHLLMKGIWESLRSRQALEETDPAALETLIAQAAAQAVARIRREHDIGDALARLEEERLAKLARDWLELERARSDFTVLATEEALVLQVAGMQLRGRIDRMDRLADGSCVLIDYKTGRVTPKYWEGPRPDDPQLPVYAVNATAPVSALAYACLRTGASRFMGFSRADKVLPKVKQAKDWDALMAGWAGEVERLGRAFRDGGAEVDPKQPGVTCQRCSLQPLCRVHERLSALAIDDEDAGEEEP